jgi:hypothetical protein
MRCTPRGMGFQPVRQRAAVRAQRPGTEVPSTKRTLIGMFSAHLKIRDRTKPANRSPQVIVPTERLQPSPLRFPGQRFGNGRRLARDRCFRADADRTEYVPIGCYDCILIPLFTIVKCIRLLSIYFSNRRRRVPRIGNPSPTRSEVRSTFFFPRFASGSDWSASDWSGPDCSRGPVHPPVNSPPTCSRSNSKRWWRSTRRSRRRCSRSRRRPDRNSRPRRGCRTVPAMHSRLR